MQANAFLCDVTYPECVCNGESVSKLTFQDIFHLPSNTQNMLVFIGPMKYFGMTCNWWFSTRIIQFITLQHPKQQFDNCTFVLVNILESVRLFILISLIASPFKCTYSAGTVKSLYTIVPTNI